MKQSVKNKVLAAIADEFGVIENIPNIYGSKYNAVPHYVEDENLTYKNIHTANREVDGIEYLVRQYSPECLKSDHTKGVYFVYYKILN